MSTRSSARNLPPPFDNPDLTIRRRSRAHPTFLNDFEMATERNGNPPVPDLRTMEELCQPSLNGRGGPIALIAIQATNFGLKNDMIQQVQNSCQFHGLPGDDANMHLDKFLHVTQSIKLRNEITNFRQRPDESLFKAWERYKLSIDHCPNHNMLPVTQIDTFYNGLTLRHRNTINAAAGGTFMKRLVLIRIMIVQPTLAKPRTYMLREPIKVMNIASSSRSRTLPSNTITNPKEDLKGITTRSGTAYQGHMIPTTYSSLPQVVERETEVTKDMVPLINNGSTKDVQPPVVQIELLCQILSPLLLPSVSPLLLPGSPQKVTRKTGDPGKFLIPFDFSIMDECLALADLSASINLMPLSVWNKLSLSKLSPTCMTLKLFDRLISNPVGVAKDVFVKVGTFHFPADFVVVDFDADPHVPLILRRSFLKTKRDLIDVLEGELTLRVGKEAITFNLDQTSRYSANYNDITANRIDVIDMVCEEYSQKVLGFSDVIASGNPTTYYDPIVSTSSPTLTPFGDSDFLLEEVDAFLALEDDATSREVDQSYFDPERDILLLEVFLNHDPSLPPPNQGNYFPQVRKELKICEAKTDISLIDEPPELELKDLPPHLEYAFLEGNDKLRVIITKDLSDEEKTALIKVLKSHKRAIAWKLSDIKGINPKFYTHKILMEDDFESAV
nr:reverse transcriptase domain-containing protein [Tanacetum cinerariifolium]